MGRKMSPFVLCEEKCLLKTQIHLSHLCVHRFWKGPLSEEVFPPLFFQLYSDRLTLVLKNSSAFEMGSFHAAGVLHLPGEFRVAGIPGSLSPLFTLLPLFPLFLQARCSIALSLPLLFQLLS